MIHEALHQLVARHESLTQAQARELMEAILAGKASDAQIAGILVALHMKGETVDEIVGFAQAIRAAAVPLHIGPKFTLDVSDTERDALGDGLPQDDENGLLDTCGTGGDASGTFNISTASALVTAAAGVRVAKHGNRSISSKCGSADVMEALGVNLDLSPSQLAACLREVGIAFLFAPAMHSATRHVQAARRELKIRTVFNLLGPLTNPAGASAQVVGVYSADLVNKLAQALKLLGLRRAMVVHGFDGLDEITISGPTKVAELRNGKIEGYEVTPEQFGLQSSPLESIAGGDASDNADIIRAIFSGQASPYREVVLLNAAAALAVAGIAPGIAEGIVIARDAIDSGKAKRKLEDMARFTSSVRLQATEKA